MMQFFTNLLSVLTKTAPYWGLFLGTFALCYALTPVCRGLARRCGMVDAPSARRINKVPTPRAGGLAIFLSVSATLAVYMSITGAQLSPLFPNEVIWRVMGLSAALVFVGLADDKFGLPPLVKLLGQVAVALGAFFWCGAGFHTVPFFANMPVWLDCVLTTFWIVGAVNAFNLIDGMDGLATGLALIAAFGMGGALAFIGYPQATLVYLAFAGACLAFLRYNFHPASVFLGDTGSMYLGFLLSVLPLVMKSGDSLFVSLGVPLLAMGVPIFDTTLAIMRRSIRAVLSREQKGRDEGNTHVMQADTDHLHHRILRKFVSQRKAAFALYALAAFFVSVGFGALALRDRAAGLYIVAFVVGVVIVVRDMRRIELWDAGRLLNVVAHDHTTAVRRRRALLTVPFYVATDALLLVVAWFLTSLVLSVPVTATACHTYLPLRVVPVFFALVFFRAYSTVWSRARISNYVRLACAVATGVLACDAIIILMGYPHTHMLAFTALYAQNAFLALVALRFARPILRDVFYALDSARLADDPATSRILVYGAGLRYSTFRRELVRSASRNSRVVVGLLDDDILLRGHYIGGIRVCGSLSSAKVAIRALRADTVVIACQLTPERLALARKVFADAGVRVTLWSCEEKELDPCQNSDEKKC